MVQGKSQSRLGQISAPISLTHLGNVVTSPLKMAEILNNYFIEKVENICQDLLPKNGNATDCLSKSMNCWKHKDQLPKFKFKKVDQKRVKILFKLLKNSHSECIDGLSNHIIKIGIDSLAHPMTHLINKCFETNKFPAKWKIFKITASTKVKTVLKIPKTIAQSLY